MGEQYAEVNSVEYGVKRRADQYSLLSLDQDFLQHIELHLSQDERDGGQDEIDAKGVFDRAEVSKKLRNLRTSELEGRLGVTFSKVDDVLRRAERRTQQMAKTSTDRQNLKGKVKYKAFLGK